MNKEPCLDDNGNKITEEYIIVSKTAIEKRIEELETWMLNKWQQDELRRLKILLSQSISLISEIEKAFDKGSTAHCNSQDLNHPTTFEQDKQDYILNLKIH